MCWSITWTNVDKIACCGVSSQSHIRNKLQWYLKQNSCIFIQENAFANVVWEMAAILFLPQCVTILTKISLTYIHDIFRHSIIRYLTTMHTYLSCATSYHQGLPCQMEITSSISDKIVRKQSILQPALSWIFQPMGGGMPKCQNVASFTNVARPLLSTG